MLVLTGRNQVEEAIFDVKAEIVTQEDLTKGLSGKIEGIFPGREPGTFVVVRKTLNCWCMTMSTSSEHNKQLESNNTGTLVAAAVGAAIGTTIGRSLG